jgi:hypothetical protein
MNEYGILFYLLSRHRYENEDNKMELIGSNSEDLCNKLGYTGKLATIQLKNILIQFSEDISPFGLKIQQNPFNNYWYLTQAEDIQDFFKANPVFDRKRLAATLSTIISLCLIHSGPVEMALIKKIRKKKDIHTDIEELISMQLIIQKGSLIRIHPNMGYYLDIDKFSDYMEKEAHHEISQVK